MRTNEPVSTVYLTDGYYHIKTPNEDQPTLVYLYDHEDFNGVRHIAYGAQHGGGIVPVTDLREDVVLTPVQIIEVELYYEYYYKNNNCFAESSSDDDCVCWHKIGTGPYSEATPENTLSLTWRESKSKPL